MVEMIIISTVVVKAYKLCKCVWPCLCVVHIICVCCTGITF